MDSINLYLSSFIPILDSATRLTVPLLLACLAGLYSERSGVFDIGLEGKMLAGAFGAACVAYITGNAWLGLGAGIGVSILMALIHGLASITLRGDQIISGVAINFLASGLTVLLGQNWFRQGGRTPSPPAGGRFTDITLPFADEVADVPILGPLYSEWISGHNILVYIAALMVPLTWYIVFRTRFGLRLRATGENPKAVDTAGIQVNLMRYQAIIVTGVLTGIAGAYFSIAQSSGFIKDMTAGKGFIALAALIFAKWRPVQAMFACFLFGFLEALQIRLQGASIGDVVMFWDDGQAQISLPDWLRSIFSWEIPVQLVQALPYILTVVLLAGFIGKAIGPKAGGVPYVKER